MYIHSNKYIGSFLFNGLCVSGCLNGERIWMATLQLALFNLLFHYYLHEAGDFFITRICLGH
jgi:hypothetical protein